MVSEITVTVKNEEKKFISKFLVYETFTVSQTDPVLLDCVKQTIKEFGDNEPDSVAIRITVQMD